MGRYISAYPILYETGLGKGGIIHMDDEYRDFKLKSVEQNEDGSYKVIIETPEGAIVEIPKEK